MNLFLDTSCLVKLYHQETGSADLQTLFSTHSVQTVFLSEISKVEFVSTLWKKVRTQELSAAQAMAIGQLFDRDFEKYSFVPVDDALLATASLLIAEYGPQGLRTLDGIQFATCQALRGQADVFLTADKLLQRLFALAGLVTAVPPLP